MHESTISDDLRRFVLYMAASDDVHSVSCQFQDFALWEGLLNEQVRRTALAGKTARDSFFLCGPDGGLPGIAKHGPWLDDEEPPFEKWFTGDTLEEKIGGDIHIPYEGVCGADFFVYPAWRKIYPEAWQRPNAELDWATSGKQCNYLLIDRNLGEPECAIRTSPCEGWWLYSSNAPYKDCNPLKNEG